MPDVTLREVQDGDLPILFEHQLDPDANRMAAFTVADPSDHAAFVARWQRIRADESVTIRTIVAGGAVAGSVLSGATRTCPAPRSRTGSAGSTGGAASRPPRSPSSSTVVAERPLYGRCAADNLGSRRVLEKCGFALRSEESRLRDRTRRGDRRDPARARGSACPDLAASA